MNLIDRYVSAIGSQLPPKSRRDIETEIRSTLEDMLEERAAAAGRPADEPMIKDLLKEYGAPDKVAASYLPARYLIGPELYPIFSLVLKIVFTVLAVIWAIVFGLNLAYQAPASGSEWLTRLFPGLFQIMGGAVTAFGNIVLVFAIIQWLSAGKDFKDETKEPEWSPDDLSKEPEPDAVSLWEPVVAIVFIVLGLLVLNFYPQALGIFFFSGETSSFIPVLTDAFFRVLPWINLAWGVELLNNLLLLRSRRWTPPTRLIEIGLKVAGVAIAAVLLAGPPILALNAASLAEAGLPLSSAETLAGLLHTLVRWALIIAIIAGTFDALKELYRLITRRTPQPLAIK